MNRNKTFISALLSVALMSSASANAAGFNAAVDSVKLKDSTLETATVTKSVTESDGRGIAALYSSDGRLISTSLSNELLKSGESGNKTLTFSDPIIVSENEILRCFIWETDGTLSPLPMSDVFNYNYSSSAPETTQSPDYTDAPNVTDEPVNTETPDITNEPTYTEAPDVTDEPTIQETASPTLSPIEEGVISAFRYVSGIPLTGSNTDGIAPAQISASENGTDATMLALTDNSYTDDESGIVRSTPVLAPISAWGDNPYIEIQLSTVGYTDIALSAKVGATKKGPASYMLQYSYDGTNYTTVSDTYTLTSNKTLYRAFDKVSIPDGGGLEKLYVRIAPADTTTIAGEVLTGTSGEFGVNDILIYGTATGEATAVPEATEAPAEGDGIIHLLGNTVDASGISGVQAVNSTVQITAAGEYIIEGTLEDGQIIVSAPADTDEVTLNLNGVSVSSTTDNAFNAKKGRITLVPAADTDNTFTASADGACGIYSKNDLTIKGEGKITANSSLGNGIRSKDDIEIGICDLIVNAYNNGIKGDNSVKITKKNKSVTVVSGNDGIKSDTVPEINAETGLIEGGTVTINGGVINITATENTDTVTGEVSSGDGIQADTLLTIAGGTININAYGESLKANASSVEYLEDSTTVQTPAEGDGKISVSGGTLTLSANEDGIKAVGGIDISGGSITVTKSLDGIQVNEVIYDTDGTTVLGYASGYINISNGTLDITSSEDGMQCGTGDIRISDGDITINSQMDCIQSDYITAISGGSFNLTAFGGAPANATGSDSLTTNSCKGIKAGELVSITGGSIKVNSYDDAVHSNHTARISGGTLELSTGDDGVHADSFLLISGDAEINVLKSYEGIEAAEIYVSGGITLIVSTDDGANAAGEKPTDSAKTDTNAEASLMAGPGSAWGGGPSWGDDDSSTYGYMEISDGILYIEAEGDGFDSNGSALISGGYVFVNGPTSGGNGVFDIGDGSDCTLYVTGGTVIGAGTSDMAVKPDSASDSQYYVVSSGSSSGGGRPGQSTGGSSNQAGSAIRLTDSSGNEILTYIPSKSYSWVLISSPEITGGSYTMTLGGTTSGGEVTGSYDGKYGLVTGAAFTGGTSTTLSASK